MLLSKLRTIKTTNRHRYSVQRIKVVLLGFLYTLPAFFFRKKTVIVFSSAHNKSFSDNSKALFEYLHDNEVFKERIYFVINDIKKREALNKMYPGRFIGNATWKELKLILSAKYWVVSWLDFPAPGYLNKYIRTVYHLGHGMPYKRAGMLESDVTWLKKVYYKLMCSNISYTVATTNFFKDTLCQIYGVRRHQVITLPQPKTGLVTRPKVPSDPLLTDSEQIHILYAPTWRPYGETKLFPFPDFDKNALQQFLARHNMHIWIRLHPSFESSIDKEVLSSGNIHKFSSEDYIEVNSYLHHFLALITDYSSIYYDFLVLERPVLFFDYDLPEYMAHVGLIDDYQVIKYNHTTKTMAKFIRQLWEIKRGQFDRRRLNRINQLVNHPIRCSDIPDHVVDRLFGMAIQ